MRKFLLLLLCMSAMWGQTAVYPTTVSTDANLLVQRNSPITTLNTAINGSITSIVLASGAKFGNNMAFTIGTENIFCTTLTSNTFSGCTRGFDGSATASHNIGDTISGFVLAAHHNVLAAEIKAIETYATIKFHGTGVPGTVTGSREGDRYLDDTNKHVYTCYQSGPCTSVAAGNWQQDDNGGSATVSANTLRDGDYILDGSGSANAITGTTATTFPVAYSAGQVLFIKVANTNTGATTLNVNTLGNKNATKDGTTALAAGNLVSGHGYTFFYDGTQFQVLDYTKLAGDVPVLNQNTTGNAATSSALFANGTNCSGGTPLAAGVDAAGNAEGCTGTAPLATALAANPANCTSGNLPRGVDASGAAEGCNPVNLSTETTGAAPTATALAANGTNCSGGTPLAGGVDASGNAEGCTGTAPLATALAANPGNCSSGNLPRGVDASGVAEGCNPVNLATETTGAAPTATALAANGGNCSAGNAPLGVDASGAVEGCFPVPQQFFGTTAPGSVSGNLPGARFSDTTNHVEYFCNATSGTAAPACTSVTAGGWTLVGSGSGSGAPCGSSGDIQYNNSGSCGGRAPQGNGTKVQMSGESSNPPQYTVAIYDANGNIVRNPFTCLIASTGLACGDGTASSGMTLSELTANGNNYFAMYGRDAQTADGCIVVEGLNLAANRLLFASATTQTMTDGRVCRLMTWGQIDLSTGIVTGILPAGNLPATLTSGTTFPSPSLGAGSSPITETWTVGTGGVTANTLVQTDASAPTKILNATTGVYGVALTTVSAAGSVEVARYGTVNCVTDSGGSTAGDLVIIGTGTTHDCKDSGQTSSASVPIGTRIVGVFRSSVSAASSALVELTPAHFGTQVLESSLTTSDVTTGDCGITKHGFAPKGPNDASKFLDGTCGWSIPPGGGGTGVGRTTGTAAFSSSISDGGCDSKTFTWTGVGTTDTIAVGFPSGFTAGLDGIGFVSASDTVKVVICNHTGAPNTPGSLSIKATLAVYNLSGTSTINFSSIGDGVCLSNTFSLTGVAASDPVIPKWPSGLEAGLVGAMVASATDTVQVRLCNWSGAALDPASATFGAAIAK